MEYLFVGIGGAFGACARYAVSIWISRWWKKSFPAATFFVNLTGSFLLGFLISFMNQSGVDWNHFRALAAVGFLGAYTTYSTFAFEIVNLTRDRKAGVAAVYLSGSLIFGLLAAFAGFWLAGLYIK